MHAARLAFDGAENYVDIYRRMEKHALIVATTRLCHSMQCKSIGHILYFYVYIHTHKHEYTQIRLYMYIHTYTNSPDFFNAYVYVCMYVPTFIYADIKFTHQYSMRLYAMFRVGNASQASHLSTIQAGEANDCVFTGWSDVRFLKFSGSSPFKISDLVFNLSVARFLTYDMKQTSHEAMRSPQHSSAGVIPQQQHSMGMKQNCVTIRQPQKTAVQPFPQRYS